MAGRAPAQASAPAGTTLLDKDPRRLHQVLLGTTLVRSLGRGVFITVLTVYLTRFIGATPSETGLVITTGSLAGVCGSYAFPRLSDHRAPRSIMVGLMFVESLAFAGFAVADRYLVFFPLAMALGAANLGGSAVRSVVVVREFEDVDRVTVRAKMYMANNVGIGVGSSVGAASLVSDQALLSKLVMVGAAAVYAVAAFWGLCLPKTAGVAPANADPHSANGAGGVLRDRRFVIVTLLSAVVATQLALIEVAMPLWIILHTSAPRYMVTVLLVFNTVLVIGLQLPVARRSVDTRHAGRLLAWAACALVLGNVLMWAARGSHVTATVVLSLTAVVAWTLGEVASQAGAWTLSFELTPPRAAGAYQGLFTMGWNSGIMLGPALVTVLAVSQGLSGWLVLSGLLAAAGVSLWLISIWIARSIDEAPIRVTAGRT